MLARKIVFDPFDLRCCSTGNHIVRVLDWDSENWIEWFNRANHEMGDFQWMMVKKCSICGRFWFKTDHDKEWWSVVF